jgi:2-polyprenyl-6-methoxyphenol hydroxylase-like FAD-dependent oxidoreductase
MPSGLKIAIAGAGIGGLAAATLLQRGGHDVTIFERFETPAPVGSGLVIQPVGQFVLDRIGCGGDAHRLGARIDRMVGHEAATDRVVLDARYAAGGRDRAGLGIHRASLFDLLFRTAQEAGAHFCTGNEIAGVSGNPPRLTLKSGNRSEAFDLVVDAAGSASPLRRPLGSPLGYGAIWGTIDWPDALPYPKTELRQKYRKASRMLGILPIGRMPGGDRDLAAIFWSLPQSAYGAWLDAPLDDWKSEARALWPEFGQCLDQITDHGQMVMARYSHGTLRSPVGDGIAHIGDSAHMTSPQLGQGANMALLDALALARAIEVAPDAQSALVLYAKARRWHVRIYQALSVVFTPMYQSDSVVLPVLRDRVLMPLTQLPLVPGVLGRIVCGDLVQPFAGLETIPRVA